MGCTKFLPHWTAASRCLVISCCCLRSSCCCLSFSSAAARCAASIRSFSRIRLDFRASSLKIFSSSDQRRNFSFTSWSVRSAWYNARAFGSSVRRSAARMTWSWSFSRSCVDLSTLTTAFQNCGAISMPSIACCSCSFARLRAVWTAVFTSIISEDVRLTCCKVCVAKSMACWTVALSLSTTSQAVSQAAFAAWAASSMVWTLERSVRICFSTALTSMRPHNATSLDSCLMRPYFSMRSVMASASVRVGNKAKPIGSSSEAASAFVSAAAEAPPPPAAFSATA
mmetsp:Transcript_61137/g.199875  ORF Transcript_61137/g.199875 Transcript_61137/m.199875 type:complete len:283 (+) Transcript_61137:65-913(+)